MSRARLSLDLDSNTKQFFETVVAKAKTGTLTELIKKSVSLFDLVAQHKAKGGTVILRHRDGREERIVIL
jgi:hypothetical protein